MMLKRLSVYEQETLFKFSVKNLNIFNYFYCL